MFWFVPIADDLRVFEVEQAFARAEAILEQQLYCHFAVVILWQIPQHEMRCLVSVVSLQNNDLLLADDNVLLNIPHAMLQLA